MLVIRKLYSLDEGFEQTLNPAQMLTYIIGINKYIYQGNKNKSLLISEELEPLDMLIQMPIAEDQELSTPVIKMFGNAQPTSGVFVPNPRCELFFSQTIDNKFLSTR